MLFTLIVATLIIAAQAPQQSMQWVPAQEPPATHKSPQAPHKSYGTLFKVQPIQKGPQTPQIVTPGKPVPGVVKQDGLLGVERGGCNMPIIAANADIDPRIIIPIPEEGKRSSRIRVIEPSKCWKK